MKTTWYGVQQMINAATMTAVILRDFTFAFENRRSRTVAAAPLWLCNSIFSAVTHAQQTNAKTENIGIIIIIIISSSSSSSSRRRRTVVVKQASKQFICQ